MKWYLINFTFMTILLLGSCVQESSRSSSQIINQISGSNNNNNTQVSQFCTNFWNTFGEEQSCVTVCPDNTKVADQTEVQEVIDAAERDSRFTPDQLETLISNIESAEGVCVQKAPRPSEQYDIASNTCICLNGKSDQLNNCQSICNTKPASNLAVLYGTAEPFGADVLFNPSISSLEGWCTAPLPFSEAPGCSLEIISGNSSRLIDVDVNGNNFTANLNDIDVPYFKTFLARVVENQSGSFATTKTFQIRRKPHEEDNNDQSLLKVMPVSQYNCISVAGTEDQGSGNFEFDRYIKTHYYFASSSTPPAIPDTIVPPVLCHDLNKFGTKDEATFPRLGLRPQHFALWDVSDIRFVDQDNNGFPDINNVIENELAKTGNNVNGRQIFNLLQWPNMPGIPGLSSSENPNLGIFMQPWLDQDNNGYCPDEVDLQIGDNPVFRELGKYIGETEAVYLAESEYIRNPDGSFVTDVMIMRETDLEKIWFYIENQQPVIPDRNTINSRTIYYYWPIDESNPRVRKSDSLLYTIRYPSNIGQAGSSSGLATSINPPDKRFGCVPKSDD